MSWLSRSLRHATHLLRLRVCVSPCLRVSPALNGLEPRELPALPPIIFTLQDPVIRTVAAAEVSDGQISRADMIALFRRAELDGTVSATELADLRTIVRNAGTLHLPDDVRVLAGKVVFGDPANAHYQGIPVGNLTAGSSGVQLEVLLDKWFLGTDHPALPAGVKDATGHVTPFGGSVGYVYESAPLFAGSGPSFTDVRQGQLQDCYLLSTLADTALRSPATVRGMFKDNGDGTFTVRFFRNGVADYVTVDRYLPVYTSTWNGQPVFAKWVDTANNVTALWVALAEKAYAQMNESGGLGRARDSQFAPGQPLSRDGVNAYGDLAFGQDDTAFQEVAGAAASTRTLNPLTDRAAMIRALRAGKLVTAATLSTTDANVVPGHGYAVCGYDPVAQTFSLYNPWGVGTSATYSGWLTLTWDQFVRNFGWWTAAS